MKQLVITARSGEDLERQQDQVIKYVNTTHEPVRCTQYMKLPANGPCLCGSGRKWKKCCMWEDRTTVTFYPKGWKFGSRPTLESIMAAALVAGLSGLDETHVE